MIPPDPYVALGLPRDASEGDIRSAYRALALVHHPDRGGDPAAFQRATEAHDVLSDPARRARYDATGTIDDAPRQHPNADVLAVLVPVMSQALEEVCGQGGKPDTQNVVAVMRRVIEKAKGDAKKRRDQLEKARAVFTQAADRFRDPKGEDALLAGAAKHHLATIDAQVAQTVADEAKFAKALEYRAKCSYEFTARNLGHFSASSAIFWGVSGNSTW